MNCKVHRLKIKKSDDLPEKLETFLNGLRGEVISVLPHVQPVFQGMGATSKTDYLLIVEKVR